MTRERRNELSRTAVIALAASLLVCMGVHHGRDVVQAAGALLPASCTAVPAYTVHAEVGVADSRDDLPSKAPHSTATPPAATKPPATR